MKSSRLKKFFGIEQDPKELVRKWQTALRNENRGVERQIREITREEKKVRQSAKDAAKRGDMNSARILARELVQSKRTVTQLHANRAHIMSIQMSLKEQLAIVRVSGTLQQSSAIMETVTSLIKVPELMKITQGEIEMEKAGLIEEMVMDSLDSAIDTEDLEEETDAEVNKVLDELAIEIHDLPSVKAPVAATAETAAPVKEEEEDVEDLQSRLNAIRN